VKAFISITVCLGVMLLVVAMGEVGRDFTPRIAYTNSLDTGISPDILVDFETGSDGDAWVTNSAIAGADLTNAVSIGQDRGIWTIVSNNVNVASNTLLRVSTTRSKSGTRSLRMHATQDFSFVQFKLKLSVPRAVLSYWLFIDQAWNGNDFGSHDMSDYRAGGGGTIAINNVDTQPQPTGNQYGAHTDAGVGTQFEFQTNTWFNVQIMWDSNTSGMLLRYYSNGVSLGQSSNVLDLQTGIGQLRFGHCDDHGKFVAGFAYYDDIEIYTNGAKGLPWPITPKVGF